jgi:hypothetical protein
MAKLVHDDVLDGALNIIKNNCTKMTVCSTQPTTYAEGNATYALADVTMTGTDFTVGNGDVSGRKLAVAAKSAVTIDADGTALHIALLDVSNSKLLYVTTCSSQALSTGGTVDIPTWDIELSDPA